MAAAAQDVAAVPAVVAPKDWEVAKVARDWQITEMPHAQQFRRLTKQAGIAAWNRQATLRTCAFGKGAVGLKYVAPRAAWISVGDDATQVYKYLHWSGDHALIIREVRHKQVDLAIEHDCNKSTIVVRCGGSSVYSQDIVNDRVCDVKLGHIMPDIRVALSLRNMLSLQGKIVVKQGDKIISTRKTIMKAICTHALRKCGYNRT